MHAHDDEARAGLVRDALAGLSERERLIVRERHLLEETITLEALGERLGVSKERVRQIEGAALAKLKRAVEARIGDPVAAGYLG
jgi:RNA polymerase sigma-32 factor